MGRPGCSRASPWAERDALSVSRLAGLFFWSASYLGNEVLWRGEVYELLRGGLMRNRSHVGDRGAVPTGPQPPITSLLKRGRDALVSFTAR
jgi:hypothetical protein